MSSRLCDLFPRATHEGNRSHNPELKANNPYVEIRLRTLNCLEKQGLDVHNMGRLTPLFPKGQKMPFRSANYLKQYTKKFHGLKVPI